MPTYIKVRKQLLNLDHCAVIHLEAQDRVAGVNGEATAVVSFVMTTGGAFNAYGEEALILRRLLPTWIYEDHTEMPFDQAYSEVAAALAADRVWDGTPEAQRKEPRRRAVQETWEFLIGLLDKRPLTTAEITRAMSEWIIRTPNVQGWITHRSWRDAVNGAPQWFVRHESSMIGNRFQRMWSVTDEARFWLLHEQELRREPKAPTRHITRDVRQDPGESLDITGTPHR